MSRYEVTTMGDVSAAGPLTPPGAPPPGAGFLAKFWDGITYGPERRWVRDQSVAIRTEVAADIAAAQAAGGKLLDRYDPRVAIMHSIGDPDLLDGWQTFGKAAVAAGLGALAFGVFNLAKRKKVRS